VIGARCSLGQNVFVADRVVIGDGCKIQNNVSLYEGVTLEDDVFCGPSMVFTNVYNPRAAIPRKNEYRNTLVKKGATLGANCTIICGVTIGEYAFVGAGAVVNQDVKPYALMVGVPARQIGWMSVALLLAVLGRRRGVDDRRIHHGATLEQGAPGFEHVVDRRQQLLGQTMALQQAAEVQDRRLIGYRILDEFQTRDSAHRFDLVQGVLHSRIRHRIPLLHEVDAQHAFKRYRWSASLAGLREMRLDHRHQFRSRHYLFHFREKLLPAGAFLIGLVGHRGEGGLLHWRHSGLGFCDGAIVPS
jgi:acetyltransferase-like isoleucine patch superfamily enzyme